MKGINKKQTCQVLHISCGTHSFHRSVKDAGISGEISHIWETKRPFPPHNTFEPWGICTELQSGRPWVGVSAPPLTAVNISVHFTSLKAPHLSLKEDNYYSIMDENVILAFLCYVWIWITVTLWNNSELDRHIWWLLKLLMTIIWIGGERGKEEISSRESLWNHEIFPGKKWYITKRFVKLLDLVALDLVDYVIFSGKGSRVGS